MVDETLKERQKVIETLAGLKQEKADIETKVEELFVLMTEAFSIRAENNKLVASLKKKRNKLAAKDNKSKRNLKKQMQNLEMKWQTGQIPVRKEKEVMKRISELKAQIDNAADGLDPSEIHEQMLNSAKLAGEANEEFSVIMDKVADLTVTYEGLIIRRKKMHDRFTELNISIKEHFDSKGARKQEASEEQIKDLMSILETGETINLTDFLSGGF